MKRVEDLTNALEGAVEVLLQLLAELLPRRLVFRYCSWRKETPRSCTQPMYSGW